MRRSYPCALILIAAAAAAVAGVARAGSCTATNDFSEMFRCDVRAAKLTRAQIVALPATCDLFAGARLGMTAAELDDLGRRLSPHDDPSPEAAATLKRAGYDRLRRICAERFLFEASISAAGASGGKGQSDAK